MVKRKYESDSEDDSDGDTCESTTVCSDDVDESIHDSDEDFIDDDDCDATTSSSEGGDEIDLNQEVHTPPPRGAKVKANNWIQDYVAIVQQIDP